MKRRLPKWHVAISRCSFLRASHVTTCQRSIYQYEGSKENNKPYYHKWGTQLSFVLLQTQGVGKIMEIRIRSWKGRSVYDAEEILFVEVLGQYRNNYRTRTKRDENSVEDTKNRCCIQCMCVDFLANGRVREAIGRLWAMGWQSNEYKTKGEKARSKENQVKN